MLAPASTGCKISAEPDGAGSEHHGTRTPPGARSSGPLIAAASGLSGCVPAPDALAVGQVGKLAGDLLAVWLVLPADLPDGDAGAFADLRSWMGARICWSRCSVMPGAIPVQRS